MMTQYKKFRLEDLFKIEKTHSFNKEKLNPVKQNQEVFDYVTRTSINRGILGETSFVNEENINDSGTFSLGLLQMDFFYRDRRWYAGQFVRKITPKVKLDKTAGLYIETIFHRMKPIMLSVLVREVDDVFRNIEIELPSTPKGNPDWDYMSKYIQNLEKENMIAIQDYLKMLESKYNW